MFLTLTLAFIFLGLCLSLYLKIRRLKSYWPLRGVPTINPIPKGTFRERLREPFHAIDFGIYEQIKLEGLGFGGRMDLGIPTLFVTDPELIKNILVKDFEHFTDRPNLDVGAGDPYFHKLLFNMEGQEWKSLRVTMTPTFTSAKIRKMFPIFTDSAGRMVKYMEGQLDSDGVAPEVNLQDANIRFSLSVIATAAFGFDSQCFTDENSLFTRMSHRLTDALAAGPLTMLKFMLLVFIPRLFNFFRLSVLDPIAIRFFVGLTKNTIEERESGKQPRRDDFLQLMIDSKNGSLATEGDEPKTENEGPQVSKLMLTDDLILAQCILFFNAGFDTVQALLDFCLYELAINPEVQEKLFQEVNERSGSRELSYEDLSHLPYLEMIISETLRKYPPAFRLQRKCTMDYTIPNSGVTVEKGTAIIIPVLAMQNDSEIYPESNRFLPERFSAENRALINPVHYMPFGLGQRSCIANRFALAEGKLAIAAAVLHFRFEPSARTPIPMKFLRSISGLKPIDGIWLKMSKREPCN